MSLSAAEQYLLELMNRARLDPAAEAARMGIDLNDGLAAGTISTATQQVLAPNALLETAATDQSLWILASDTFSHTGEGGSQPGQRATAEGYVWSRIGENIVYTGTTGSITLEGSIDELNAMLFGSALHRANILQSAYREVGIGGEVGVFTQAGVNYNTAMLTEVFGTSGSARFLTGVAYADSNANGFYSMGEGTAGMVFNALGKTATTAEAGGYSLALGADAATAVTGTVGGKAFALTVDMSIGNVKLDIVGGTTFYTSGSLVLGAGLNKVVMLGLDGLSVTGNGAVNTLTGNAGANVMNGAGGNDVIRGGLGADQLHGQIGNDQLFGDLGFDRLWGEAGNDTLTGGGSADAFLFAKGFGEDTVTDFSVAGGDKLRFDDALWAGLTLQAGGVISRFASKVAGEILFDFGNGQIIHLDGVTTVVGLAAQIEIY